MQVICKTNQNGTRQWQGGLGQSYLVVEVVASGAAGSPPNELSFRVSTDENEVPGLYPVTCFDVSDPAVPPGWVFTQQSDDGAFVLGPRSFAAPGFWERFFDGEPAALAAFAAEISAMENA